MVALNVNCTLSNIAQRDRAVTVRMIVDASSATTWVPAAVLESIAVRREKEHHFIAADGREIAGSVGFAFLRIDDAMTVDEVVFAEEGDTALLGARALSGISLQVDATRHELLDTGPRVSAMSPGSVVSACGEHR